MEDIHAAQDGVCGTPVPEGHKGGAVVDPDDRHVPKWREQVHYRRMKRGLKVKNGVKKRIRPDPTKKCHRTKKKSDKLNRYF